MIAAHAAGIPVFVTGGVGGVHRGAETSKYCAENTPYIWRLFSDIRGINNRGVFISQLKIRILTELSIKMI